jgi:hypothetical protein
MSISFSELVLSVMAADLFYKYVASPFLMGCFNFNYWIKLTDVS